MSAVCRQISVSNLLHLPAAEIHRCCETMGAFAQSALRPVRDKRC